MGFSRFDKLNVDPHLPRWKVRFVMLTSAAIPDSNGRGVVTVQNFQEDVLLVTVLYVIARGKMNIFGCVSYPPANAHKTVTSFHLARTADDF